MIIGINGKIGSGKDTVGKIIQYLDWYKAANTQGLSTNMSFEEWLKIETIQFPFNHTQWQVKKFAYKLKQIVALLTGCTVEDLESQEFKAQKLGSDWQQSNHYAELECLECGSFVNVGALSMEPTYRELLQVIGTDALRNVVHENVWVNALMADYKEYTRNTAEGTAEWDGEKGKYIIKQVPFPELSNKIGQEIATDKWRAFIPERIETPNWIITDMRFPNELKAVEKRDGITIRVNRGMTFNNLPEHASETALDSAKFKYTIDNDGTIEDLVEKVRKILIKEKII
jgi:hypothetical protein